MPKLDEGQRCHEELGPKRMLRAFCETMRPHIRAASWLPHYLHLVAVGVSGFLKLSKARDTPDSKHAPARLSKACRFGFYSVHLEHGADRDTRQHCARPVEPARAGLGKQLPRLLLHWFLELQPRSSNCSRHNKTVWTNLPAQPSSLTAAQQTLNGRSTITSCRCK